VCCPLVATVLYGRSAAAGKIAAKPAHIQLDTMHVKTGAELVKKYCKTHTLDDSQATKLARIAACNPQLIKIMSGYIDEGVPIEEALEFTVEDALEGGEVSNKNVSGRFCVIATDACKGTCLVLRKVKPSMHGP
jgi:hypothetical protein